MGYHRNEYTGIVVILMLSLISGTLSQIENHIKVLTVATEPTDGFMRFNRSAKNYDIKVEVLGMGTKWNGGDMNYAGGGYKVNLLRRALEPIKHQKKQLVLFTDSYDVLFLSTLDVIEAKFLKFDANILFGAEHFCWPDKSLENSYPEVPDDQAKFLNSGLFLGYATDLYEILQNPIDDKEDDQLYFTKLFLNEELREKHKIKLDHKSEIFQNLNGAISEIKLEFDYINGKAFIFNLATQGQPSLVHGNSPSKITLNSLGNYLAGAFSTGKCMICDEGLLELQEDNLPTVTLGVFIVKTTPFLEEYFDHLLALDYPKSKLKLFIYNAIEYHNDVVNHFIELFAKEYSSFKTILPVDKISEAHARNLALSYTQQKHCDYLFVIDAEVRFDNPKTLRELIKLNRSVVAPILIRPGEVWSNFWGALSAEGYYARSHDYVDIVKNNMRGIWNVPFIGSSYLIKKNVLSKINYEDEQIDAELAFAKNLRQQNIFMFAVNVGDYGHLVNPEEYNIQLKNPDFYMLKTNRREWESRYLHPKYWDQFKPNTTFIQPCPDVYWFAIVSERFCDELIEIMENYGKWSDGSNQDTRLKDGYEAVPTRDIHMTQVGLEPLWLFFLKEYVRPLQEAVFIGYFHNPPVSVMNFVVRYKPTEQPYLRPHHDSSTYTINIALNRVGIDYEGGGCRFIRYDCSVADTKKGWMLLHPGRLTHFHEGMHTIKGTRYIAISFIDP